MGFIEFVLIVAAIMALNPAAMDLMLPALPDIAHSFGLANTNRTQLVLSVYMVGFGFAQFIVGPLSDRFGRRVTVLSGLSVYCLASVLATLAPSFELLLVARLLQGTGTAAARVIATSIVRDCYNGRRMASVISLAQMVFVTVPIIAPSLGQLLMMMRPDWQLLFFALLLFGLFVLVWCAVRLPETLSHHRRKSISFGDVLGNYRRIVSHRQTIGYTIAGGAVQGAILCYIFSAQQILSVHYELGRYFTLAFATVAFGFMTGGFLNSRFVERLGMRLISHAGLVGLCIVSALMLLGALLGYAPLWLYMAVAIATTFGVGVTFANFTALAMIPHGDIAGTASSLFGTLTILMGVVIGLIVGLSYDGTVMPMAIGIFLSAIGALVTVLITERGRLFLAPKRPA